MSAIITLESIRGPIEVEIHRDGTISGEDLPEVIEYDRAMVEFGEEESQLLEFVEKFSEEQIEAIVENTGLSRHDLVYLAADWAEHVLSIYEKKYKDDFRPRNAIQAARDFVDEKITPEELKEAASEAWSAGYAAKSKADAAWITAAAATYTAGGASDDVAWSAMFAARAERESAMAASDAAAFDVSDDKSSLKWKSARDAEQAWQLRRLVDCMEAIQAGKDWPDLKDTK